MLYEVITNRKWFKFFGYWRSTTDGKLGGYDKGPLQLHHFGEALFSIDTWFMYYGFSYGIYAHWQCIKGCAGC